MDNDKTEGEDLYEGTADPKHREILDQGVEAWNRWRVENPALQPNLAFEDLREKDLQEAHLDRADLKGAHLEGADLRGAHLESADRGVGAV